MDFNNLKEVSQRSPFYIFDAFPKEYLIEMINHTKSYTKPTYNNGGVYEQDPNIPERKVWDFPKDKKTREFIKGLIYHINNANQKYQFELFKIIELYYLEYSPKDTTPLDWHMDIGHTPPSNTRKVSFSIMANEPSEYEGGNLEISSVPDTTQIPKNMGGMVCFPSFLPHRVTPITKGIRKSIIGFAGGRPYR